VLAKQREPLSVVDLPRRTDPPRCPVGRMGYPAPRSTLARNLSIGQSTEVMSTGTVREMLRRPCIRLAEDNPQLAERHSPRTTSAGFSPLYARVAIRGLLAGR
jgi:hypothetical protein